MVSVPPELAAWRKGMRAELIARRLAVPPEIRRDWSLTISILLLHGLPLRDGMRIAFCWPYKGEYDARPLLRQLRARGISSALPVVVGRDQPLVFRHWAPGVTMKAGALGIPYPENSEAVTPDIALVPVVGFGSRGDRLGYGGGYFDRTLAAMEPRLLSIGVGFELQRIDSSFPMGHDIPMDAIVTEAAMRLREHTALRETTAREFREGLADRMQRRTSIARANTTIME